MFTSLLASALLLLLGRLLLLLLLDDGHHLLDILHGQHLHLLAGAEHGHLKVLAALLHHLQLKKR